MTTEIPRTLRVLWGEPDRPGGRGLSRERIVAAGIALADADGIAALSMARLAERLGSAPMSLYRHVANKDELLAFMTDAAPGPPPELPSTGWRPALETWARALRGVYYAHPWVLQVTAGRPPLDPGQLAWLDRGLSALDGTGLGPAERLDVLMTVLHFVRGEAQIGAVVLRGGDGDPADYGRLIAHFVTPERMPALAAASAAGVFRAAGDDAERAFAFGLTRVLDGVDVMVTNGGG
ncbi:TetR/AcrR family transcriptional regulator [Actinoplanes auranticolor]|uniref:TetR family transcriptional regulator n=1 Tax=Actinoplanes auranticolor TaxID=47988 RepID=A0A919SU24_9ACTN|nr:TetR/AcrR family transcriptional regulator [Actinoplanes auranticolor]GIM78365.1 TetR family transcriptional regulator [Actinoplanes auranticolor]